MSVFIDKISGGDVFRQIDEIFVLRLLWQE